MVVGQLIEGDTPGGAERLILQFAQELRLRGHSMFTVMPEGGAAWLGHELGARGFPWTTIRRRHLLDPRVGRELAQVMGDADVDAVHSHEFIGVFGAAAAHRLQVPHVITLHGSDYFSSTWRRRAAFRWAARRATGVVGVARDTSAHAERVLGLAAGAVLTIPNGIAPRPGTRAIVRRELGVAEDELIVAAVGNVSERKNHIQLLEALIAAESRRPGLRWRLIVAGEERGSKAAIEKRAAAAGKTDRVHLLGHRSDTEDVLAAADIFAMPSLHEGTPLAIIEAMFAARPVISYAAGGLADMITDGVEGLLIPIGDVAALASGLDRLLTDAALREALGRAALTRALREFGIGSMIDAYMRLYRDKR